ncbi:M10 family metallopeptidase C-terminal domain-containing protein [Calothrix anomala FACHB-343]|uniref:M10 family metallopeptidase C-terminal domain-containing protein n=1 Tax=Calothrix anomala FACHB-343 TaxID=2692894 RepID=A0ABR8B9S6_9CYAN|nr:M10 family metallopeptidase C-terminal domain-containing protein [Calothrix anomala FACHB-343]
MLNDNLNEANETFKLVLANPTNATLSQTTATVTITDTLSRKTTTTLPATVENLTLTATGNINGTGNSGNNILTGNTGNNILTGGSGNDTYRYTVTQVLGTDTIVEAANGGTDTINFTGTTSSIKLDLAQTTQQTVVSNRLNLILSNSIENITGGSGNDTLTGNSLNNTLKGGSGVDVLSGGDGADTLLGMSGNDILTGGNGSDRFLYSTGQAFSSSTIGIDQITDFNQQQDKIVLSKKTFNTLQSVLGNGFSKGAEFATVANDSLAATSNAFIVYSTSTGKLFYNQNGSASGYGIGGQFASLDLFPLLTAANFELVA